MDVTRNNSGKLQLLLHDIIHKAYEGIAGFMIRRFELCTSGQITQRAWNSRSETFKAIFLDYFLFGFVWITQGQDLLNQGAQNCLYSLIQWGQEEQDMTDHYWLTKAQLNRLKP